MNDAKFKEDANNIRCISDFWINQPTETDTDRMYFDALISIRESILLLAEVLQSRPISSSPSNSPPQVITNVSRGHNDTTKPK